MEATGWAQRGLVIGLIAWACTAHADYIVNTGQPPSATNGLGFGSIPPDFNVSFAAAFQVTTATTIGSVEAYMQLFSRGWLGVSLYAESPNGPLLFSQSVFFDEPFTPLGWRGVSGLNWAVQPGSYAVAISAPQGSLSGVLPLGAPAPLEIEWSASRLNDWRRNDSLDLPWRVSAVPESPTGLLIIAGLMGMTGARALRRRAAPLRCPSTP